MGGNIKKKPWSKVKLIQVGTAVVAVAAAPVVAPQIAQMATQVMINNWRAFIVAIE